MPRPGGRRPSSGAAGRPGRIPHPPPERVIDVTTVLHKLSRKTSDMSDDPLERAEHHAHEAEKLLKSWFALYYSSKPGKT